MPLPIYSRAFVDAPVLKTFDPLAVLPTLNKGATRHVPIRVAKDPVPMALTLYKGTFMEVSSRIEPDPVAVLFSLFEVSERFQNHTATAGEPD